MRDGWSLGGLTESGGGNAVGDRAWEERCLRLMEKPLCASDRANMCCRVVLLVRQRRGVEHGLQSGTKWFGELLDRTTLEMTLGRFRPHLTSLSRAPLAKRRNGFEL